MSEAFRGEFTQKVDGKARVSIPAAFRRILEAGDPAVPCPNPPPRIVYLWRDGLGIRRIYSLAEAAFCGAHPKFRSDRKPPFA